MKRSPPALAHLAGRLEALDRDGLLRTRPAPTATDSLNFCSNDYLGLAGREVCGIAGAGASRLVVGEREAHRTLEGEVASLVRAEAALVFTSGFAANIGVISALAQPGDVIVSDELNHASLIDGARLSRATIVVTRHLDVDAVRRALKGTRAGHAWVVTESYFSMDADSPDLCALRAACDEHGAALVVDEAHALGVLGPGGSGLCAAAGVEPDVLVGTFGKAFGAGGAFVAGCEDLIRWLWNRARSFVFSTGLSPVVATAAVAGMRTAETRPLLRERVVHAAARLRRGLADLDLDVRGYGPIVPWVVGTPGRAVRLAGALRDRGIHVQAIRPPSVPPQTARLRLTVTARHDDEGIDRAVTAIREAVACEDV